MKYQKQKWNGYSIPSKLTYKKKKLLRCATYTRTHTETVKWIKPNNVLLQLVTQREETTTQLKSQDINPVKEKGRRKTK